ncbi:MAG: thiamine pyrophosphate-requiring protein, partial [Methylocella sp.]
RDLNQVTWELRAMSGDPKFKASQDVPDFPYAKYAELLGLKGIFVDDPSNVGSAWDEAFAADRPVVLEAYTDPDVPPLPPHISFKNAKAFMSTLWKGDPNELGIIEQSVKELVEEYRPHGAQR